jgi:hypothetical protein
MDVINRSQPPTTTVAPAKTTFTVWITMGLALVALVIGIVALVVKPSGVPHLAQCYAGPNGSTLQSVTRATKPPPPPTPITFVAGGTRLPQDIAYPAELVPRTDKHFPLTVAQAGLYQVDVHMGVSGVFGQGEPASVYMFLLQHRNGVTTNDKVFATMFGGKQASDLPYILELHEVVELAAGDRLGVGVLAGGRDLDVVPSMTRIGMRLLAPGLTVVPPPR